MARETFTIAVDDQEYQITQLGAKQGIDLYNRLRRTLAPVLKGVIEQKATLANEELAARVIVDAVGNLPDELVTELNDKFTKSCKVRAGNLWIELEKGDIFDQHFAGRISHWQRWILQCLKVNFADFLPRKGTSGADPPTQTT